MVKEDESRLNAFGSALGSLDLTEAMRLGEYRVTFWDQGRKRGNRRRRRCSASRNTNFPNSK